MDTAEATVIVMSRRHGPRTFRKIGSRPYRRRDGSETTLTVWQSACVKCGAAFEVATPAGVYNPRGNFEITTCPDHRQVQVRAMRDRAGDSAP